jgi:branched-subunit amino acid aminotransferase/4-amino-4-deoxychorismate lyase
MSRSTIYQFTGDGLTPVTWCRIADEVVVVADSWRVVEGKTVGLSHHLSRFRRSIAHHAPDVEPMLDTFLSQALGLVPPQGEWFPRVECVAGPHGNLLRFYHREAPPRLDTAVLKTADTDPRTRPLTKGPDLEALMALRRSVAGWGATEAVILTPDGFIAEGAYSSLVAWSADRSELWRVGGDIPRIPSVTERVLVECAEKRSVTVVEEKKTPSALAGHTVWVLSALHGIRRATSWVSGPVLVDDEEFASHWQKIIREQSED